MSNILDLLLEAREKLEKVKEKNRKLKKLDRYKNLLSFEKQSMIDNTYKIIESDRKKGLRISIFDINGNIKKELKYW